MTLLLVLATPYADGIDTCHFPADLAANTLFTMSFLSLCHEAGTVPHSSFHLPGPGVKMTWSRATASLQWTGNGRGNKPFQREAAELWESFVSAAKPSLL